MTIRYAEERTKGEGKGDPGGPGGLGGPGDPGGPGGPSGPGGLGGPHGLDDPGGPRGPPFADFELWTEFNLMKIGIYFPQTLPATNGDQ